MNACCRRTALRAILPLAVLATTVPALAQDWPARTVTVVVPLAAGSASDVLARVVLDQVGKQLGQTFVIENRPGAGGTIGANVVAKAAPNGYTMLAYGALPAANALYAKLPYDTLNDFSPVIALGQQPLAAVTSQVKGYRTLGDLIAAGKAKPGTLNFSSAGVGSATHFAAERLRVSAGFEAQHIPFKGAQESLTELMAGRIDFGVQTSTSTLPFIRQGQIVPLAVAAHKRSAALPAVPTFIEAGLSPDSIYPFYSALYFPAKTPRDIVERLHRETARALDAPEVRQRLTTLGVEPMPMNVDQFGQFFKDDLAANLALAKAANIRIQ
jgi:tripartite-type tricarboxylate transporter receptor subunit TctC